MSLTRSIIFNGTTASITLPTTLNSDNQLDWTITLTSGANTASTSGVVSIKASESVTEPVTVPAPVPAPVPVTPETFPEPEKSKHVTVIKALLDMCGSIKGKENKAVISIKILNYIIGDALEFTKAYERFKGTVIDKCYEFKQVNGDMPDVVAKADEVLTKLGASTTLPVCTCDLCDDNHSTSSAVKAVNTVIEPVKPAAKAAAPKPVEPKKDTSALDLTLFTALAKKYNYGPAINNPKIYLSYFESAVRWNGQGVKGSTKAEKMTSYFTLFNDDGPRVKLMKTIFEKHNLIFSDAAMTLYYEWQKNYKPVCKTNRYIKMNEFATTHKVLFTA